MRTKLVWRPFYPKLYKLLPEFKRTYLPYKGIEKFYIPGPWLSGWILKREISNISKQKRQSRIYYQRYHRYNGSHKNLA